MKWSRFQEPERSLIPPSRTRKRRHLARDSTVLELEAARICKERAHLVHSHAVPDEYHRGCIVHDYLLS